jgi:hypothetical protein
MVLDKRGGFDIQIGGGEGTDNSRIFILVWTIPFSWSMVVL